MSDNLENIANTSNREKVLECGRGIDGYKNFAEKYTRSDMGAAYLFVQKLLGSEVPKKLGWGKQFNGSIESYEKAIQIVETLKKEKWTLDDFLLNVCGRDSDIADFALRLVMEQDALEDLGWSLEIKKKPELNTILREITLNRFVESDILLKIKEQYDMQLSLHKEVEVPSYNKVFVINDELFGKRYILKISTDELKAKTEAVTNYYLGQHEILGQYVPQGLIPEPIKFGELYITIQEDLGESVVAKPLEYYMKAIAMFHVYAEDALTKHIESFNKTIFATSTELIDKLPVKVANQLNSNAVSKTQDSFSSLIESDDLVLGHGDLKPDNIGGEYLLDHEQIKVMPREYSIASFLALNLPNNKEKWQGLISTYVKSVTEETSQELDPIELTDRVLQVANYNLLKEWVSLNSNKQGEKERFKSEAYLHSLRNSINLESIPKR